jgi:hypothetical protein
MQAYCAGVPGELRILFLPAPGNAPRVKQLEPGVKWRATFCNPSTGQEHDAGPVAVDANGEWQMPDTPIIQDWICVLQKV